jgi:hypothetical protein
LDPDPAVHTSCWVACDSKKKELLSRVSVCVVLIWLF